MPTRVAKTETPERWDRAGDIDISLCALRWPNHVSKDFDLMSKE